MIRTIVARVERLTAIRSWFGLLNRAVTEFPADLAIALCYALIAGAVLLAPVRLETWVMTAVALPFLFVLPGFVFLSVVFPQRAKQTDESAEGSLFTLHTRSIDGVERGVLSFGMSLVLVPIIAVLYSLLPIGYSRQAIAATMLGLVFVGIALGAIQRVRIPPNERYRLPVGSYLTSAKQAVTAVAIPDAVLNVVLAVSVVVSVSAVGYAVVAPLDGTQFTEVALMTESDSGDLVAGNYPEELVRGEPQPLTLSITNNEDARQTYQVVVVIQRVRDDGGELNVLEQRRVDDFEVTAGAGETKRVKHAARSPISGENLRLAYLVYADTPPERPTTDNAYRFVHLWVDVNDPA